jgi:hypothetical protein
MAPMKAVAGSIILLLGLASPARAGDVAVSFVHPETFTDAAENGGCGIDAEKATLDELARYLGELEKRHLRPGQRLSI